VNIGLELPPELEQELSAEASELKLSLDEYILRILSQRPVLHNPPKTGAKLVAYWQRSGVINSRPDIDHSAEYARNLRRRAETRY